MWDLPSEEEDNIFRHAKAQLHFSLLFEFKKSFLLIQKTPGLVGVNL